MGNQDSKPPLQNTNQNRRLKPQRYSKLREEDKKATEKAKSVAEKDSSITDAEESSSEGTSVDDHNDNQPTCHGIELGKMSVLPGEKGKTSRSKEDKLPLITNISETDQCEPESNDEASGEMRKTSIHFNKFSPSKSIESTQLSDAQTGSGSIDKQSKVTPIFYLEGGGHVNTESIKKQSEVTMMLSEEKDAIADSQDSRLRDRTAGPVVKTSPLVDKSPDFRLWDETPRSVETTSPLVGNSPDSRLGDEASGPVESTLPLVDKSPDFRLGDETSKPFVATFPLADKSPDSRLGDETSMPLETTSHLVDNSPDSRLGVETPRPVETTSPLVDKSPDFRLGDETPIPVATTSPLVGKSPYSRLGDEIPKPVETTSPLVDKSPDSRFGDETPRPVKTTSPLVDKSPDSRLGDETPRPVKTTFPLVDKSPDFRLRDETSITLETTSPLVDNSSDSRLGVETPRPVETTSPLVDKSPNSRLGDETPKPVVATSPLVDKSPNSRLGDETPRPVVATFPLVDKSPDSRLGDETPRPVETTSPLADKFPDSRLGDEIPKPVDTTPPLVHKSPDSRIEDETPIPVVATSPLVDNSSDFRLGDETQQSVETKSIHVYSPDSGIRDNTSEYVETSSSNKSDRNTDASFSFCNLIAKENDELLKDVFNDNSDKAIITDNGKTTMDKTKSDILKHSVDTSVSAGELRDKPSGVIRDLPSNMTPKKNDTHKQAAVSNNSQENIHHKTGPRKMSPLQKHAVTKRPTSEVLDNSSNPKDDELKTAPKHEFVSAIGHELKLTKNGAFKKKVTWETNDNRMKVRNEDIVDESSANKMSIIYSNVMFLPDKSKGASPKRHGPKRLGRIMPAIVDTDSDNSESTSERAIKDNQEEEIGVRGNPYKQEKIPIVPYLDLSEVSPEQHSMDQNDESELMFIEDHFGLYTGCSASGGSKEYFETYEGFVCKDGYNCTPPKPSKLKTGPGKNLNDTEQRRTKGLATDNCKGENKTVVIPARNEDGGDVIQREIHAKHYEKDTKNPENSQTLTSDDTVPVSSVQDIEKNSCSNFRKKCLQESKFKKVSMHIKKQTNQCHTVSFPTFRKTCTFDIDWSILKSRQGQYARNLKSCCTNIVEDNRQCFEFSLPFYEGKLCCDSSVSSGLISNNIISSSVGSHVELIDNDLDISSDNDESVQGEDDNIKEHTGEHIETNTHCVVFEDNIVSSKTCCTEEDTNNVPGIYEVEKVFPKTIEEANIHTFKGSKYDNVDNIVQSDKQKHLDSRETISDEDSSSETESEDIFTLELGNGADVSQSSNQDSVRTEVSSKRKQTYLESRETNSDKGSSSSLESEDPDIFTLKLGNGADVSQNSNEDRVKTEVSSKQNKMAVITKGPAPYEGMSESNRTEPQSHFNETAETGQGVSKQPLDKENSYNNEPDMDIYIRDTNSEEPPSVHPESPMGSFTAKEQATLTRQNNISGVKSSDEIRRNKNNTGETLSRKEQPVRSDRISQNQCIEYSTEDPPEVAVSRIDISVDEYKIVYQTLLTRYDNDNRLTIFDDDTDVGKTQTTQEEKKLTASSENTDSIVSNKKYFKQKGSQRESVQTKAQNSDDDDEETGAITKGKIDINSAPPDMDETCGMKVEPMNADIPDLNQGEPNDSQTSTSDDEAPLQVKTDDKIIRDKETKEYEKRFRRKKTNILVDNRMVLLVDEEEEHENEQNISESVNKLTKTNKKHPNYTVPEQTDQSMKMQANFRKKQEENEEERTDKPESPVLGFPFLDFNLPSDAFLRQFHDYLEERVGRFGDRGNRSRSVPRHQRHPLGYKKRTPTNKNDGMGGQRDIAKDEDQNKEGIDKEREGHDEAVDSDSDSDRLSLSPEPPLAELDEANWNAVVQLETRKCREAVASPLNLLCTVLCVDISESMMGSPWLQIKEVLQSFVTGLENIKKEHGTTELVSMVTFGHETKAALTPTTDYSQVLTTFDSLECKGNSPLEAVLFLALFPVLASSNNRFECNVYGKRVRHRMILLSDFRPTPHTIISETDEVTETQALAAVEAVTQKMKGLKSQNLKNIMNIYCVPIGENPNMELMEVIARKSGGLLVPRSNINMLCTHTHNYLNSLQITRHLCDSSSTKLVKPLVSSIITTLYPDLSEADKTQMIVEIEHEMKEQNKESNKKDKKNFSGIKSSDDQDSDTDSDDGSSGSGWENDSMTEVEGMPPIGTRVKRGPDFDQDGNDIVVVSEKGTITGHSVRGKKCLFVHWDCGIKTYCRYGDKDSYDVVTDEISHIPCRVEDKIKVGHKVRRGPDWNFGNQDGGSDKLGTVYNILDNKVEVDVRWDANGNFGLYRFNYDGAYDVLISNPEDPFDVQRYTHEMNRRNFARNRGIDINSTIHYRQEKLDLNLGDSLFGLDLQEGNKGHVNKNAFIHPKRDKTDSLKSGAIPQKVKEQEEFEVD